MIYNLNTQQDSIAKSSSNSGDVFSHVPHPHATRRGRAHVNLSYPVDPTTDLILLSRSIIHANDLTRCTTLILKAPQKKRALELLDKMQIRNRVTHFC